MLIVTFNYRTFWRLTHLLVYDREILCTEWRRAQVRCQLTCAHFHWGPIQEGVTFHSLLCPPVLLSGVFTALHSVVRIESDGGGTLPLLLWEEKIIVRSSRTSAGYSYSVMWPCRHLWGGKNNRVRKRTQNARRRINTRKTQLMHFLLCCSESQFGRILIIFYATVTAWRLTPATRHGDICL